MDTSPTAKKIKESDSETEGQEFDPETQKYLEEIDDYQNELDHINELAGEEIITVEQRYNKMRKPFFDKRADSIAKVPHFWQIAFTNHPDLYPLLGQCEDDCFNHLTKIEVSEFPDIKSGFMIEFYFEENPYFENSVLKKEYRLGGSSYFECTVTPIVWKKGMDITLANTSSNKSSSSKQPAEYKSFFAWYNSVVDPITDIIAETIKADLWVNPLQYFLLPGINVGNNIEDDDGDDEDLLAISKREIVVKEEPAQ